MEALVPFEPGADLGVLVRRIVVDDQVQLRSGRGLAVDLIEEADEFLMPMARHALADDPALQHVERGEQRRRTVTLVVMLGWTAPDGIQRARLRSLLISDKGDRPWAKLAELGWIRRSTFSNFTG